MIHAEHFGSSGDVRRFRIEAEAVARLQHPNIVPIFEVGQIKDQHYFSMQLIEGKSLDKRLKDYVTDPRRAALLVSETAAAIHHVHQNGMLHRDLKPANILIDSEGRPRITDFGLAKRVEGESGRTRSGDDPGDAGLHLPGASVRESVDDSDRRLRSGGNPIRSVDRTRAIWRGNGDGHARKSTGATARFAAEAQSAGAAQPRVDLPEVLGEGPAATLRQRRALART